jgi:arylsulfatase A
VARQLAERLEAWRAAAQVQRMRPNPDYVPHPPNDQGVITLPARTAQIEGIQLRYEALPHKETLGFWTMLEDRAAWEFEVQKGGRYAVTLLQGCGAGQGGSEVAVVMDGQILTWTVEDTGHFQNFVSREIGEIQCTRPGRYRLEVRPMSKPGIAVMDLREVVLRPVPGHQP